MVRGRTDRPERQHLELPAPVTSFVGRQRQIADVKRALSASRLVTLIGVSGAGKTRLALQVAEAVHRAYANGVWLVELASLQDPQLLAQTIAARMGAVDQVKGSADSTELLAAWLADKHALLVLDNCEHLSHACAHLVGRLLRSTPSLQVLATSLEPLGIGAEQVWPVPPMSWEIPSRRSGRPEALELFADRAAKVLPGFTLDQSNEAAVAEICRRLDGLPLAIELSAIWLKVLTVEQILDHMQDRFALLTAGDEMAPARHQTLLAAVEWSLDLCSKPERTLWARTSVFTGAFDLDAAEAVCGGEGISPADVLTAIAGLAGKSILIRSTGGSTARYRMLETIRQYGRRVLAERGEEALLLDRHREYYRQMAAGAWDGVFTADQARWLARLDADQANLRAALDHSFADGGAAAKDGLAMAADLLYHWQAGYRVAEGQAWLARGLAACPDPDPVRARALWVAGWLARIRGQDAGADRLFDDCRELGERLGDESALAWTDLFVGMHALGSGRETEALGMFHRALDGHRKVGDRTGQALTLIRLSHASALRGDAGPAVEFAEQSLGLCNAHGDPAMHHASALISLAIAQWRCGRTREATELAEQSLAIRAQVTWVGIGMGLEVLAWIAAGAGRHERAARLLGILQQVWGDVGAPYVAFEYLARWHDDAVAACQRALGHEGYQSAVEAGARLDTEAAFAYALQQSPPSHTSRRRETGQGTDLTPRERQVAHLVADGLTNKQIAAELVISLRTAEGYIQHIMIKLGYSSRTQIATWYVDNVMNASATSDTGRAG